VIILGAGAAGLFCALHAAQRGQSVTLIEQNDRIGRKIEISGGGRCNFTNLFSSPENFISNNPRFCISALKRYTPHDFISFLDAHSVAYHEKKLGQLFCNDASQRMIDVLWRTCRDQGVEFLLNCTVRNVAKKSNFIVSTQQGNLEADKVVVALGGLSIPKIGASDMGYRIAETFNIALTGIRPGLVPLLFSPKENQKWAGLRGISLPVKASCRKAVFHENLLFTHKGLSGPAILQISNYWREGNPLSIDLLPDQDARFLLNANKTRATLMSNFLGAYWPNRFAQTWCKKMLENKPLKQYNDNELEAIAAHIHNWNPTLPQNDGMQIDARFVFYR